MQRIAVVILAGNGGFDPDAVAAELIAEGIDCYLPGLGDTPPDLPEQLRDARRVAHVAMWLRDQQVPPPLLIVAAGEAARLLPALSLSQRSAARLVVGYVIVDAVSPAPSHEWPDAPVWWVATDAADEQMMSGSLSADLRGFEVRTGIDAASAILSVLVGLGRHNS